ncbi:MAG TPA: 30S ribosomal protein S20 [Candidatus Saccharimonadales bacterium]|nr:30S ribosomal protein S20 [Candidatus Saccharimonadales bacterium]
MPIIKSAKKRVKIAAKARSRNLHTKRDVRDALKAFAKALEGGKATEVAKTQAAAMSALDTAAKKAVIHKNKAARQKSRLSAQAKAAGVKPQKAQSAKPKTKSTAAKKPAAKKTTAKK